jgi:hypothetical protein
MSKSSTRPKRLILRRSRKSGCHRRPSIDSRRKRRLSSPPMNSGGTGVVTVTSLGPSRRSSAS